MKLARFEVSCGDDDRVVVDGYGSDGRWVAGMTVEFLRDEHGGIAGPRQVSLRTAEILTAGLIVGFPWHQWLVLAEASASRGGQQAPPAGSSNGGLAGAVGGGTRSPSRRVRQAGSISSAEHYRSVAARYQELSGAGEIRPSAVIAREWMVSRRTAEGWVRRCCELGFLVADGPGDL